MRQCARLSLSGLAIKRCRWTLAIVSVVACSEEPEPTASALWPHPPSVFTLVAADGESLPVPFVTDRLSEHIDSATLSIRWNDDLPGSSLALYLTPGGGVGSMLVVLSELRRITPDSALFMGPVPGQVTPEIFMAYRDSTLSFAVRPVATGQPSHAVQAFGPAPRDWVFRAKP